MRDSNKVLIVAPPVVHLLLPERVLSNNDGSYPLFYQEVNNALTGRVQVVIDLAVTLVCDLFHLLGDALSVIFGKLLFEFLHALVVPLVPRLDRTTVN